MSLRLDYFYGNEAEQYSFYRIPKVLFTNQSYSNLTIEARALYGLLLDRMGLSARNGWLDDRGRVFIYFTLEDVMDMMGFGHNKAVRHFKELVDVGLIERKKQGQGRPVRIYVKNFILPAEAEQAAAHETSQKGKPAPSCGVGTDAETSSFGKSALRKRGSQDFSKSNANNTEKNDIEESNTDPSIYPPAPGAGQTAIDRYDQRERIKRQIDYDSLHQERPYDDVASMLELLLDVMTGTAPTIRIGGQILPVDTVKHRFSQLDKEHIAYVLDSLKHTTTKINNIRAYLLTALYNAPVTIGPYYSAAVRHDLG